MVLIGSVGLVLFEEMNRYSRNQQQTTKRATGKNRVSPRQ